MDDPGSGFVPMFMLGYSPELVQVAYRIGDSCTNLITPLMAYFAMVVVFAKKSMTIPGSGRWYPPCFHTVSAS